MWLISFRVSSFLDSMSKIHFIVWSKAKLPFYYISLCAYRLWAQATNKEITDWDFVLCIGY